MSVSVKVRIGAVLAGLALAAPLVVAVSPAVAAPSTVTINEIESSGGNPGDWVELVNTGTVAVDLSGYVLKDNDDTHVFTIPAGSVLAPGAFVVEDVETSYGLGGGDSVRLFAADGVTLLDSYTWATHSTVTYGRCPDGTGAFTTTVTATKGVANDCGVTAPPAPTAVAWQGGSTVSTADVAGVLGGNMSGLAYEASGTSAPGILWAVKNGPSTLYRLIWDGANWVPDAANGWAAGKALHYPDGTGDPDTEGVTLVDGSSASGVYLSTERNNSANRVSRPEVLRFDVTGAATSLNAVGEWNLTTDLPVVAPNSGLEAVQWMSDAFLTSKHFVDERTSLPYSPTTYANHGTGLFFVGLEGNGSIYAYAFDLTNGTSTRVATIVSGFPGVMDLEFEPETSSLWAVCDDTCNGRSALLQLVAGRFTVAKLVERPAGMLNINNEGFAIAPQALCVNGLKPVYWADDSNTGGNALRAGTISCSTLAALPGVTPVAVGDPELAATGAGPASWLLVALAMLLLVAGLVLVALRVRRARRARAE